MEEKESEGEREWFSSPFALNGASRRLHLVLDSLSFLMRSRCCSAMRFKGHSPKLDSIYGQRKVTVAFFQMLCASSVVFFFLLFFPFFLSLIIPDGQGVKLVTDCVLRKGERKRKRRRERRRSDSVS